MRRNDFSPLRRRDFRLFLLSQVLAGAAASVQTIAASQLLLDRTQSGLTAGLSVLTAPLPGVLFSLLAGRFGDRRPPKGILLACDFARAALTLLFLCVQRARHVTAVLFVFGVLDVLYSPARGRMLTALCGKGEILNGSSLLTGGAGFVSLTAPAAAGAFVQAFGAKNGLLMSGGLYLLSALCLAAGGGKSEEPRPARERGALWEAVRLILRRRDLKDALAALTVFDFGTVCVNLAFYALAFDELGLTSGFWGLMLSVLYGMSLLAMAVLNRRPGAFRGRHIESGVRFLPLVALVWSVYSAATERPAILLCAGVEGFAAAMATTLLTTALLEEAGYEYAARVTGVRDALSSFAKAAGALLTYGLMRRVRPGFVFSSGSALLFAFSILFLVWRPLGERGGRRAKKSPAGGGEVTRCAPARQVPGSTRRK